MEYLLDVEQLTTEFNNEQGPLTVVDRVSFNVKKGEIMGIVGESGCGKSVTSLSILGLLGKSGKVSNGKITYNGKNLLKLTEKEMRKMRGKEISMIFQDPMTSLNPVLTIGKQIEEMIRQHKRTKKSEIKKEVIQLLKLVEMPRPEEIYAEYPHRLSGGMKQRVMIAMALACKPSLLIADEPTTALDVTVQAQILDLLKSLKVELGMAILIITHDLGVVAEMCDRVIVMYAGQVVETGDTRQVLRKPKHPYTIGLIGATPKQGKGETRLKSIPGQVPTPDQFSRGCHFADRCSHVMDICHQKEPGVVEFENQTSSKCWLYNSKESNQWNKNYSKLEA